VRPAYGGSHNLRYVLVYAPLWDAYTKTYIVRHYTMSAVGAFSRLPFLALTSQYDIKAKVFVRKI
jgi:hypothetical protein